MKKMLNEFLDTKIWGKRQFHVLFELHGNGIYSAHIHSGSERKAVGPVLAQFLPHVAISFQIRSSELCKMGISVYFRDESAAKGSLRRVQRGEPLSCQMEWKRVQKSESRSQPWMTEWDRKKMRRNCWHNQDIIVISVSHSGRETLLQC